MAFCPECGAKIEEGWKRCGECGALLEDTTAPTPVEEEKPIFPSPIPVPIPMPVNEEPTAPKKKVKEKPARPEKSEKPVKEKKKKEKAKPEEPTEEEIDEDFYEKEFEEAERQLLIGEPYDPQGNANPATDPYYDDIIPEIEEELKKISKRTLISIAGAAVAVLVVIAWIYFIISI